MTTTIYFLVAKVGSAVQPPCRAEQHSAESVSQCANLRSNPASTQTATMIAAIPGYAFLTGCGDEFTRAGAVPIARSRPRVSSKIRVQKSERRRIHATPRCQIDCSRSM